MGHTSKSVSHLIKNKTQTAVINMLNLHIVHVELLHFDYDLMFRMYSTYIYKSNRCVVIFSEGLKMFGFSVVKPLFVLPM